jgi:predicted nuclease of predicted toxin-antitoxin system
MNVFGPKVTSWLKDLKYNVISIYETDRGTDDDTILQKCIIEDCILITNDKDFGEMIFRENKPHNGFILLRLGDERSINQIKVIGQLLDQYIDQLSGNFVVATETTVRVVHLRY